MMNLKVVCAFCCCFVQHLFYSTLLHSELSSTEQSFTCNYRRQPDWNPSLESTTFQIPPTMLRSSCAPKTPYNLKIGFYWQGILTVSQCKNWLLHCGKKMRCVYVFTLIINFTFLAIYFHMVAYQTSGFWFKIPAQMIFETCKQVFLVCI